MGGPGPLKGPPLLCSLTTTTIMPITVPHALGETLRILGPGCWHGLSPVTSTGSPTMAMGDLVPAREWEQSPLCLAHQGQVHKALCTTNWGRGLDMGLECGTYLTTPGFGGACDPSSFLTQWNGAEAEIQISGRERNQGFPDLMIWPFCFQEVIFQVQGQGFEFKNYFPSVFFFFPYH